MCRVQVQLQLEPVPESGRSSSLEEQIRQEGVREVVTGCLRAAVTDLNFAGETDFPPFVRTEEPDRVRSLVSGGRDGQWGADWKVGSRVILGSRLVVSLHSYQ